MLWPWAERVGVIALKLGEDELPLLGEKRFPEFWKWSVNMRNHPVCKATSTSAENNYKTVLIKGGKLPPDYDNVERFTLKL